MLMGKSDLIKNPDVSVEIETSVLDAGSNPTDIPPVILVSPLLRIRLSLPEFVFTISDNMASPSGDSETASVAFGIILSRTRS